MNKPVLNHIGFHYSDLLKPVSDGGTIQCAKCFFNKRAECSTVNCNIVPDSNGKHHSVIYIKPTWWEIFKLLVGITKLED